MYGFNYINSLNACVEKKYHTSFDDEYMYLYWKTVPSPKKWHIRQTLSIKLATQCGCSEVGKGFQHYIHIYCV